MTRRARPEHRIMIKINSAPTTGAVAVITLIGGQHVISGFALGRHAIVAGRAGTTDRAVVKVSGSPR